MKYAITATFILLSTAALADGKREFKVEPRSQGMSLEAAVGQCRYDRSPDGMWWQANQEHSNNYKDNSCRSLRAGFKLNPIFNAYLGFVNLGRAHTRATAVTTPGDDATKRDLTMNVRRQECKGSFNEDNCMYFWSGDGGATRAMQFTVGLESPRIGPISLEAEAGILLYRMRWTEQVCPSDCQKPEAWRVEVNQTTSYYLSPVIGARIKVERCFGLMPEHMDCFAGGYYYARISDHLPISSGVGKTAQTWMAGVAWNF